MRTFINKFYFGMMKPIKLLFLFSFFVFLYSCEDDEICIESLTSKLNTSVTAKDSTSVFSLSNLKVTDITRDKNEVVFTDSTATSFKVSLPINDSIVTYKIDLAFASSDSLQTKAAVSENLTVNYKTTNEYVSKACGFKAVYKDINYSTTGILTINAPKNKINNENETHINLQY